MKSQMKRFTGQGPEEDRGLRPRGVGTCHPPGTWICPRSLKLSESHTFGTFYGVFVTQSRFTRFLAPVLFREVGVGAKISKLLILVGSF